MQVSDSHKFIFFHVHKTGGTSVAVALGDVSSDPLKDRHLRPSTARKRIPSKFKRYFKFAFVRNPWDMWVSCYTYDTEVTREFMVGGHSYGMGFADYLQLRTIDNRKWWSVPQYSFLTKNSSFLVDHVGRYERIQQDFNGICVKVGLETRRLPVRRKTKHGPYQDYYTDASRKLIAEVFAEDVKEFGYTFK